MQRASGSWMVLTDDRILEQLRNCGQSQSAWQIATDLDSRGGFIRQRCRTLTHAGFLHREERDGLATHYELTVWGILYLEGQINAEHRTPHPATRPPEAIR